MTALGMVQQSLQEQQPKTQDDVHRFVLNQLTVMSRQLRTRWNTFASQADDVGGVPLVADVKWFGGPSNANFFNDADNKWYQDAAFTKESDDDSVKFQAAIDFVNSLGGGGVHFGGQWYLKEQLGEHGEMVQIKSGVQLYGDGGSSRVTVRPGLSAEDGFSAAFGHMDYTTSVDDVQFRDFVVDCNSAGNQWLSGGLHGVTNWQAAGIAVQAGDRIFYDNVTVENLNGAYGQLIGTYGFPERCRNCGISGGNVIHCGDDPNQGDASFFVLSGINTYINDCTVDADLANQVAWPAGLLVGTAYEIHGKHVVATGLKAIDTQRFLNVAADSFQDVEDFVLSDCVAVNVISGITFYEIAGRHIKGFSAKRIRCTVRPGIFPFGEAGIDTATSPNLLGFNWDGNGFKDCHFEDCEFILSGTPTAGGNSVGIRLLGNCDNVTVDNCKCTGWGFAGIIASGQRFPGFNFTTNVATNNKNFLAAANPLKDDMEVFPFNTGGNLPALTTGTWPTDEPMYVVNTSQTGTAVDTFQLSFTRGGPAVTFTTDGVGTHTILANRVKDLSIRGNKIRNSGSYGIELASFAGEVKADLQGLFVAFNRIVEERAATLSYGIQVAAYTDSNCIFEPNYARGYVNGLINFDLAAFPNGDHTYENQSFLSTTAYQEDVQTTSDGSHAGMTLFNPTIATGGVPQQYSPEAVWVGYAWDGAASKQQLMTAQFAVSDTLPTFLIRHRKEGGAIATVASFGYSLAGDVTTLTGAATGLQIQGATDALGFYGAAPIALQTVAGAKGGNVALGNLLTALANLGLIVDTTGP